MSLRLCVLGWALRPYLGGSTSFKVALRPCRGLCVLLWLFVWLCVLAEGFCVHLWLKWVVVVDEGAPRVDAAGELVLHDDILHPRESQK